MRFFENGYPSRFSIREGNIRRVIDEVENTRARFGIIFVTEKQKMILQHFLRRRMLSLETLAKAHLVISVNRKHVLNVERFNSGRTDKVRFIRCQDDYETPENQLKKTLGEECWQGCIQNALQFEHIGCVRRALETTDMMYLNFCLQKSFPDEDITDIPVDSEDGEIYLCLVYNPNEKMAQTQKEFIRFLHRELNESVNGSGDEMK